MTKTLGKDFQSAVLNSYNQRFSLHKRSTGKKIDNSARYASKDDHSHSQQIPKYSKERKKNASINKLSQKNSSKMLLEKD